MAQATRKSVIVTFKPKDKRPDKVKDKLEIVTAAITSKVSFLDPGQCRGALASPRVCQRK